MRWDLVQLARATWKQLQTAAEQQALDMAMKPDDSGVLESAKTVDCEISACAVSAADAIREALDKAQRPVIMLGHGVSDKAVRDQYLLWHASGKYQ